MVYGVKFLAYILLGNGTLEFLKYSAAFKNYLRRQSTEATQEPYVE